jgi:two-component sensor histidine kinase
VEGPAVTLGLEAAQNLGLALHELASNAANLGSLSVPSGRIAVRWNRREHDDQV